METKSLHTRHQRQVFYIACGLGLLILVGFSINHYIESNFTLMWVHIVMALLCAGGLLGILLGIEDLKAYRLVFWGVGVGLLCLVTLGPSHLYYNLLLPLLLFFFLGRREGVILNAGFLIGMTVLLFAPEIVDKDTYPTEKALKFLVANLFVGLVGWGHEGLRQRLYALLETRNERLQQEMEQLTDALSQIKEKDTKLGQTLSELKDQTQLMETVFNSMNEGICVVDATGRPLLYNPSAEQISGMGIETSEPSEWAQVYGVFCPDKETPLPMDQNPLIRAAQGLSTEDFEVFVRNEKRPDGVCVSGSGRPIRNVETGEIKAGVVVFRDITKLKETEAELKRTIAELRRQTHAMETVFNSISDGVVVADEKGNFTFFNPSAERIVGIGSTDTGPDQWTEKYGIFFPDRETPIPMEELPLVRAIQGEASDEVEMFLRNPNVPEGVFISVSGRPLQDDTGRTKGGVIVFRDVTERIRAEEALSQAFAQGRLEIVETILHNIGNAINSVAIGVGTVREQLARNKLIRRLSSLAKAVEAHREDWIPYLQKDPQGQEVMPFILALARDFSAENAQLNQTVERVESRVAHIVEIIRTQRSLDNGAMASKDINLQKAITDAITLLRDSIAKREIHIEVDCENAPKEIRTQESKFHQMLVNLIKNSMEAIDELENSAGIEGKPSIRIRAYIQEDYLVLDVIDNGIGIEEKHSKIIFAAGYTTKKGGSGLGLHSMANFIIGSGGQIYPLSGGTGKGTTMRVKLRLAQVTLKPQVAENDISTSPNPGQSEADRAANH